MNTSDLPLALESLVDRTVTFTVSDPWEFGSQVGAGPFSGHVRQAKREILVGTFGTVSRDAALIQVAQPFPFSGLKCEFFIAAPRHVGSDLLDMVRAPVAASFIRVSSEEAASDDPFIVASRARSNTIALVGTIEAASE